MPVSSESSPLVTAGSTATTTRTSSGARAARSSSILPADPGALVLGEDLLPEGGGEVIEVVVRRPGGEVHVGASALASVAVDEQQVLDELERLGGAGQHDPGVMAKA